MLMGSPADWVGLKRAGKGVRRSRSCLPPVTCRNYLLQNTFNISRIGRRRTFGGTRCGGFSMSIYKKLAVMAVVVVASGALELLAMQTRGGPPVMMPPTGGRRGGGAGTGTGGRRGAPPPAPNATVNRIEKKNYTFKETNQKIEYNV